MAQKNNYIIYLSIVTSNLRPARIYEQFQTIHLSIKVFNV